MVGPGELLRAPTDPAWYALAVERSGDLLIDHANCEKKAASTALSLMFAYPEDFELANRMSRLAREELRHFELVQQKLAQFAVPFRRMSPSRYAEGLRRGELTVADLGNPILGLGDLGQYDLSEFEG